MTSTEFSFVVLKTTGNLNCLRHVEWRAILRWFHQFPSERTIDVACGPGILTLQIARRGKWILGVDISGESIRLGKSIASDTHLPCAFSVQDATGLACSRNRFDAAICSSALQNMKDPSSVVREMNRVLKLGGRVILTCDSLSFGMPTELALAHARRGKVLQYFGREELQSLLEDSGFTVTRARYLLNSNFSDMIFRIGVRQLWAGWLWIVVSLLAYPFCLLSDVVSRQHDAGHTILMEATKSSEVRNTWAQGSVGTTGYATDASTSRGLVGYSRPTNQPGPRDTAMSCGPKEI